MTSADALSQIAAELNGLVQMQVGCVAVAVPSQFNNVHGSVKSQPVLMTTRRWSSALLSSFTLCEIKTSTGEPLSLTAIALPRDGDTLPILGMDLIALGGAFQLVAVDIAPTDHVMFERDVRLGFSRVAQAANERLVQRKRPEFVNGVFSDLAIFVAARRGTEEHVVDLCREAAEVYFQLPGFDAGLQRAGYEDHAPSARSVRRWCQKELENRKEHDALSRIFTPKFADDFLRSFLFADASASSN